MARTALSALQSTITALIAADEWFAGILVLAETGTESNRNEREKALAEQGLAITVYPPEDVTRIDGGRGSTVVRASFSVWVEENPEQNQKSGNKNSLEAVARIVALVTAYDSGPGERTPESESTVATLLVSSDGVRIHELPFSKTLQLS